MTLRAKHRRNIVVDGRRYHWSCDQLGLWERDLYVVCQSATGRGRKLLLQHIGPALPKTVADAIHFAHEQGWSSEAAADLELGIAPHHAPGEYHFRPPGVGRYWFHDWWMNEYRRKANLPPLPPRNHAS